MKNIDWSNLGFGYYKTDKRFVSKFNGYEWDKGELTSNENVVLNESACVFQYSQVVFEGMKAFKQANGDIVCFRPDMNAKRMYDSAVRLAIPPYDVESFVEAVKETIKANIDYVPPYGTGASLYIRPFMFGITPLLGVKPAIEYEFRVFCSPVGPYFKNGINPLNLRICDLDRAAPRGTGNIKAGLNYAMSLFAIDEAHKLGYDENVYLDPLTRTKIEETGGANIFFVSKDKKIITPNSKTILPSITRNSLIYVAKNYLGLEVEEREIFLDEISDFVEAGLCGTAAVISPIGSITNGDEKIIYDYNGNSMGEITKMLYNTITGIQYGLIDSPKGWIYKIE